MSGMNDEQIERVFGALSRIETKVDGTMQWLGKHVEDDKKMAADINTLALSHAKQRGFFSALAAGGSLLGAGIGYIIEKWLGIGHN